MKVLIVGGGIGGLTLAAFLEHSNIDYEIVEKCPNWEHQGFILGLWDNGRDILKKLGLAERLDTTGTRIQAYSVRDGKGRIVRNYNLRRFWKEYGSGLTCIDRADLHDWLLQKVDQSKIRMNTSLKSIKETESGVDVAFSDDSSGRYDAIIGADGIHSQVRTILFPDAKERYDNWRIWYTWIDDKFNVPGTMTEYIEPGEMAVVFKANGKTHASFLAPASHSAWDTKEGRVERLKHLLKDESALIPSALVQHKDEDLQPSDLLEVRLDTWVHGRVALLGDAAHGFGPHAGIGASMAMEDAYALASEIMQVSESYSANKALKAYEEERKERVRIARDLSQRIRGYTLIRSPLLRKIMNVGVHFVPETYLTREYDELLKTEI